MANIFLNIPVVVGVGPAVDISLMGAEKTIVVQGQLTGALTLEISEDAGVTWCQLVTFTLTGEKVISFAANRIRARSSAGSGTVDIGANDDGGLYVDIPAPPMNGIGAPVNISGLGGFSTVNVQGPCGGGVIGIQISEDGIDYAEFATFPDPGCVTQNMIGDFVRAVSRGATPPGGPYAPVCSMGAINDVSGGGGSTALASNCFIYQPGGGGNGPAVFADWNVLYAALQLARLSGGVAPGGCFEIEIDDSIVTPALIPDGVYDMDSVTISGLWRSPHNLGTNPVGVKVTLGPAVFFPNLRNLRGPVNITSTGPIGPVTLQSGFVYELDDAAAVVSTGAPFFDGSGLAPGDVVGFGIGLGAILGDGLSPVISGAVGVFIAIDLDAGIVFPNALDFPVGSVLINLPSTVSAYIDDNQPAFLGTVATILTSTWRFRDKRSTGVPVPVTINAQMGDIVRCNTLLNNGAMNVRLPKITPFNDGQSVTVFNLLPSDAVSGTDVPILVSADPADTIQELIPGANYIIATGYASVTFTANFGGVIGPGFGSKWDLTNIQYAVLPSNTFVYMPGAGPAAHGPSVFNFWIDLYRALLEARRAGEINGTIGWRGGNFTIAFDNSFVEPAGGPCVISPDAEFTAYDMRDVTWVPSDAIAAGVGSIAVEVNLEDGVKLTNFHRISGPLTVRNLGASPVLLFVPMEQFFLDRGTIVSAGAPFFLGNDAGLTFYMEMTDGAMLGDNTLPVISLPNGGEILWNKLGSGCLVTDNAVSSAGAIWLYEANTVSSQINDNQPSFAGSVNPPLLQSTWRYRNNGRNIGPTAAVAAMGDTVRCVTDAGDVDVTLPKITAFNDGQTVSVCKVTADGANSVNTSPAIGDTIRNAAGPFTTTLPFESIVLCADFLSLNWDIISCCDAPPDVIP